MTTYVLRPIGASALDTVRYGVQLFRFVNRAVAVLLASGRTGARVTARNTFYQVYFTGYDAIPVVAALGLMIGAVIIVQTLSLIASGGALVGTLMDMLIIRQLGPIMTAFIVIGRSGSAITVELGNMRVLGELDLLEQMGIDPVRFLVVPRMIGVTWAVLCLCVLFDLVAMFGGYCVASMVLETTLSVFIAGISEKLTVSGLVVGLLKSALFGIVIAAISTYQGLQVKQSITEVPQATRRSVVHSLVACVAFNALVTIFFFYSTGTI